jgi:hypothetical protein
MNDHGDQGERAKRKIYGILQKKNPEELTCPFLL